MKDVRERRERERAVRDQTNVAGTTLGKIMGVKEEVEPTGEARSDVQSDAFTAKAAAKEEEGESSARADAQYGEPTAAQPCCCCRRAHSAVLLL